VFRCWILKSTRPSSNLTYKKKGGIPVYMKDVGYVFYSPYQLKAVQASEP